MMKTVTPIDLKIPFKERNGIFPILLNGVIGFKLNYIGIIRQNMDNDLYIKIINWRL